MKGRDSLKGTKTKHTHTCTLHTCVQFNHPISLLNVTFYMMIEEVTEFNVHLFIRFELK